ncbi:MAG: hypothetical protein AAF394_00765, partial [Planctomycetota bacterium]
MLLRRTNLLTHRRLRTFPWAALLLLVLPVGSIAVAQEAKQFPAEQIEYFEEHIRPLLIKHCYFCHSTDAPE